MRLDKDGDGKLSREEVAGTHAEGWLGFTDLEVVGWGFAAARRAYDGSHILFLWCCCR